MKAIMVMYDTLARNFLEPYGCDWVQTPNFTRLARHAITFDSSYVGSLPCMPARRELHTGRYNFLHRSWGPLEPFDDSMPQILRENDIYSHLVSDHQHYWEDGGATYHTRYESWECVRGQEGDPWKALLGVRAEDTAFADKQPQVPLKRRMTRHDAMNRSYIADHEDRMPQAMTFSGGIEFIDANHDKDNWFVQIETFDPHEPFFTQKAYKDLYPHEYDGPLADWPPYDVVTEDGKTANHVRCEYAALVSMCDAYLGRILDKMDEYDLWDDTLLIVNTDHGFLLGEHGWWGKGIMPLYEEISHTPLFIWDPRSGIAGQRRKALVQTIDLPATILDFFGLPLPESMEGHPLTPVIERDEPVREYGLFGMHGNYTCITDGRYVYLRAPVHMDNGPTFEYTLMPAHMRSLFSARELSRATLRAPFSFTKGCPVMMIPANPPHFNASIYGSKLFDVLNDPDQEHELDDVTLEVRMSSAMVRLMNANDAPAEQYERLGLPADPSHVTAQVILDARAALEEERDPGFMEGWEWEQGAKNVMHALMGMVDDSRRDDVRAGFEEKMHEAGTKAVRAEDVRSYMREILTPEQWRMAGYFTRILARQR